MTRQPELDALRGLMLVLITVTHLPTTIADRLSQCGRRITDAQLVGCSERRVVRNHFGRPGRQTHRSFRSLAGVEYSGGDSATARRSTRAASSDRTRRRPAGSHRSSRSATSARARRWAIRRTGTCFRCSRWIRCLKYRPVPIAINYSRRCAVMSWPRDV